MSVAATFLGAHRYGRSLVVSAFFGHKWLATCLNPSVTGSLDTKIIFLSALDSMIWLLLYFANHRGSHLVFHRQVKYSIGYFNPEYIPLDTCTNIIFLAAVESNIWLLLYFGIELGFS